METVATEIGVVVATSHVGGVWGMMTELPGNSSPSPLQNAQKNSIYKDML